MEFTNNAVDVPQLPDFRDSILQPVAGSFLPYCLTAYALFWMALIAGSRLPELLAMERLMVPLWVTWLMVAAALLALAYCFPQSRSRAWALREHDLIYRSGVLWHKTVIIPFVRIQHVETGSGPLQRAFGLMRLRCYTAGSAMSDLTVHGLTADDAEKVRQYLLEQIRDDAAMSDTVNGNETGD